MRWSIAVLPGLALVLAGCGDKVAWERWQAEREAWRIQHAQGEGGSGTSALLALEERHAALAQRYPAAVWSVRARTAGAARDIARVSAQAGLRAAELALRRGDPARAAERAEVVAEQWEGFPELSARAWALRARAEVQRGDEAAADTAWARAAEGPLVVAGRGLERAVAEAAVALVRARLARGLAAAADAARHRAEARARPALADPVPLVRRAAALWLADLRAVAGDAAGAHAAACLALAAAETGEPGEITLAVAARALAIGLADSAIVHARALSAARDDRRLGGRALLVVARAERARGDAAAALAAVDALLERWYDPRELAAEARFERAEALAALGRWEAARAEYRALAAAHPTAPLAFLSLQRIVAHHARSGERDLMRLEGEWAMATLARAQQAYRDPGIQRELIAARTALAAVLGDAVEDSLGRAWWERHPADSAAQRWMIEAVVRAPGEPGARQRLLSRLARTSASPEVREAARRAGGEWR